MRDLLRGQEWAPEIHAAPDSSRFPSSAQEPSQGQQMLAGRAHRSGTLASNVASPCWAVHYQHLVQP